MRNWPKRTERLPLHLPWSRFPRVGLPSSDPMSCSALERSAAESRSRPLRAGLARRGIAIQGQQVAGRYVVFCLFQVGHRLWVIKDGERLERALGVAPVQLRVLLGQEENAVDRRTVRRLRARRSLCIRPGLREAGRSEIVRSGHRPSVSPARAGVAVDLGAHRHSPYCCSIARALTGLDQ